jgi:hypothetical protein
MNGRCFRSRVINPNLLEVRSSSSLRRVHRDRFLWRSCNDLHCIMMIHRDPTVEPWLYLIGCPPNLTMSEQKRVDVSHLKALLDGNQKLALFDRASYGAYIIKNVSVLPTRKPEWHHLSVWFLLNVCGMKSIFFSSSSLCVR